VTRRNISTVAESIAGAIPVGAPAENVEEKSSSSSKRLPEGCRVIPLGIDGKTRFYLDANRQLIALKVDEHTRLGIAGLFGDYTWQLFEYWPRLGRDGDVTGWRPEAGSEALMAACARKGPWQPFETERGLGAWRGDEGELVLHCGDVILSFPRGPKAYSRRVEGSPGVIGRYVYPAAPGMPRPSPEIAKPGEHGPAGELLSLLRSWNWRRGEIDAVLLLGWVGAAIIGGALGWRPLIWITGSRGTGKSTLHELVRHLLGSVVQVSDPSAAGIWQKLRHSTLPVAVDELEAEEDNRKGNAIVKLARQAASGGLVLRGGADHQASEFKARSAFLFSSILMPSLQPQDRSRLAVLELGELPPGARSPALEPKRWSAAGVALRRRLVDGWGRFDETLAYYRAELALAGHNARGADQFGTLLACADVLLFDAMPEADSADGWISQLGAASLAENEEEAQDEDRCLRHLMTSPIDPYRSGTRQTLDHFVAIAAGETQGEPLEANRLLGTYGLKVLFDGTPRLPKWLAVANSHRGLADLFAGTHWAEKPGASSVWRQALRRLPGAMPSGTAVRFGTTGDKATGKATLIPMALVLGGADADEPGRPWTPPLPHMDEP